MANDKDKPDSGRNYRGKTVKVKTARGRKNSSTKWLKRQLNDPYVARAKQDGYRSRAAYKLLEINEKSRFLRKGINVVDLGSTPGSWSQVAVEKGAKVVAIDLNPMEDIDKVTFIEGDFLDEETFQQLKEALPDGIHVVLSDMAAQSCGHHQTDHLRIMALCEAAFDFAVEVLEPGGVFLAKVLQGGTENSLLLNMKKHFDKVKHIKPKASRSDSTEMYVCAEGFRGR